VKMDGIECKGHGNSQLRASCGIGFVTVVVDCTSFNICTSSSPCMQKFSS
jgi:hypothetical protein